MRSHASLLTVMAVSSVATAAVLIPPASADHPRSSSTPSVTHEGCAPKLDVDVGSPQRRIEVSRGVEAMRWLAVDQDGQKVPIVAVAMHRGAGRVLPMASRGLEPENPLDVLSSRTLAVTSGGLFRQWSQDLAAPVGTVVMGDRSPIGSARWARVLAVDDTGALRYTRVRLEIDARIGGNSIRVRSIASYPDDALSTEVLTGEWTPTVPPSATKTTFVMRDSTVLRRTKRDEAVQLRARDWVLRTSDRAIIAQVRPGMSATLAVSPVARDGLPVLHAAGHLGVILKGNRVVKLCSDYEQLKRPRSLIAWNEEGTVWFIVAGTRLPDSASGIRVGGATKTQLAEFAKSLGARGAVAMDGGGSSILGIRQGDRAVRLDSGSGNYVRPLPLVWAFSR